MADVEVVVEGDRIGAVRAHERDAFGAEGVDDAPHRRLVGAGDGDHVAQPPRVARRLAIGVDVGEGAEQILGDARSLAAAVVGLDLRHHRVGMVGEQPGQATRVPIVVERQPPGSAGRPDGGLVHLHQAVLDQRQLVLAAARLGDQPLGEIGRDLAVVERRRLADRAEQIGVLHPRQQVLRLVDGRGEALELGAGAEELRSHRQDDEQPIRLQRLQAEDLLR